MAFTGFASACRAPGRLGAAWRWALLVLWLVFSAVELRTMQVTAVQRGEVCSANPEWSFFGGDSQ